jgi:hypothetical protein
MQLMLSRRRGVIIVPIANPINIHVSLFSLTGAHRAMNSDAGRGPINGAPSSARPFGKKRRCISSGPISSLAWDLGADPLGKRYDLGLTRPRDDVGRVDRPCYKSDLGRLLRLRAYIHCRFPSRLTR